MIRILPTGSPLPTKQDMRKEFQELEDFTQRDNRLYRPEPNNCFI